MANVSLNSSAKMYAIPAFTYFLVEYHVDSVGDNDTCAVLHMHPFSFLTMRSSFGCLSRYNTDRDKCTIGLMHWCCSCHNVLFFSCSNGDFLPPSRTCKHYRYSVEPALATCVGLFNDRSSFLPQHDRAVQLLLLRISWGKSDYRRFCS